MISVHTPPASVFGLLVLCAASCGGGEVMLERGPSKTPLQISIAVPDGLTLAPGRYLAGADDVPVQVVEWETKAGAGKGRRLVGILPPSPEAGRLALKPLAGECKPRFALKDISEKTVELSEGDRPVFAYHHGVISREGVPPRYNRSNYFHPVYGPNGEVLTDDFPKDHYHHRGLFWAWVAVLVGSEGKKYESWIPSNFNYVFERWLCRNTSDLTATLGAEVSWQAGDRKVVREEWVVTVYPATEAGRVMDIEIVWTALDEIVTVKGEPRKGYGGFSVRFAPRKDTVVTTSEGKSPKDLEAGKIAWADLSATFEGAAEPSGLAVFVHPGHPGAPLTWLTRHYGFLCPEYPGVGAMALEPTKPVRVAYRVWIHKGVPEVAAVREQDEAYRQSTAVKLAGPQ